jgi:hypothetical protein
MLQSKRYLVFGENEILLIDCELYYLYAFACYHMSMSH